jgi:hypothetical protein
MPRKKVASQSPTPLPKNIKDEPGLTFDKAIKCVMGGGKITKKEWNSPESYGFLNGKWLSLHKPDGINYQWLISDGDMLGEDWVVIEEAIRKNYMKYIQTKHSECNHWELISAYDLFIFMFFDMKMPKPDVLDFIKKLSRKLAIDVDIDIEGLAKIERPTGIRA